MMEEKLPKGWRVLKIKEMTSIIGGGTPSTSIDEYYDGDIPWLSPVDLSGYKKKYISRGRKNITKEGLKKSSARLLPKNSVLFSSRAPIGYIAIAENELTTNQGFKNLLPSPLYDPSFAYYFLKYKKDYIESQASGTTFKEISGKKLGEIEFILPPLPEQQRIVAKLDALFGHLDSLREKLDRIPVLLKNFRQQVLTQAVTGELTKEWREGKGLGEWEETTIGSLFEIKTGGTPRRGVKEYYEGGTIPWVKSGLVKNELIFEADEFITEIAIRDSNVKIFPVDTLLVAMYGEGKTRGQVGWLKLEATTNQAIAALVNETMPTITRTYVFYYCLSQYNDIRAKAEGGNQPNLNLSKVKNWEISMPPLEEQKEIVSQVDALFSLADKIESQYASLKAKIDQLPQAILAKAFRGELVEQEVKEYVVEESEGLMAAEGVELYKFKTKT